ncbi:VENN motif pre-toxin domain-containing protein [Enterobacteriaceae bacterium H18W14]|uniref:VENN motif pre-toxin domain-containing protein n=1 Tax=Dryocola boscaweniae TaxID=2925397 RepID=UPI0022F1353B|nr:VENN motif pre-toxin domain-containing protein [Dryocola boscaweniae]MCT4713479.1 VENN motif pre-toxin domain-containing protein [Dryocola boscaweniae]
MRLKEAQVISQISGQMSNIVMTLGETEAMKAAREKHGNLSDAELRNTPEYRDTVKGYGTGSTPQMVVQAITGVLGGLNADNFGQALAGGLNPAVAQLIKQTTGDDDKANLMAHAVWGALAAQLGGNSAAAGAAGAFSGEAAAQYIINNYYGGKTDNLSEQERRQISTLATIAAGIAGGLAGNSTEAAGAGAVAGKNAVENNALGDKLKKPPINIIDINPIMKVGVLDEDSQPSLAGGGIAKGGKPKDKQIWTETKKDKPVTNAYGHWEKHKTEFPEYQNAKQYVDATHNFVTNPPVGTLTKTRANGDTLYYNPATNTFASKDINGVPRTMFKPQKGLEYWNKQ